MKKRETPDDEKRRKENGELGEDIVHKIWEKISSPGIEAAGRGGASLPSFPNFLQPTPLIPSFLRDFSVSKRE